MSKKVLALYWMFSGKKDQMWGIFPTPGVSSEDIAGAGTFGKTVLDHLETTNWNGLQSKLIAQNALKVKWDLMFIEARAGNLFSIWDNLIKRKKNRRLWLVLFKYYLLIALFIAAPIVVGIYGLIFRPFLSKSIKKRNSITWN